MQAAKIIRLGLIILFVTNICKAQQITGTYTVSFGYTELVRTIKFDNGQFTEITPQHLGIEQMGKGTYLIKDKQLIFSYENITDRDSSVYTLSTEGTVSSVANVEVQITDDTGKPTFGYVTIRDKDRTPLVNLLTGKDGKAFLTLYPIYATGYLSVDYLGYYRVYLPIAKLIGTNAKLKVKLINLTKSYIPEKEVRYQIIDYNADRVILSSEKEGRIVLQKSKN